MLIEAGLMGMRATGTDSDPEMIEGARRNMEHYGVDGDLMLMDIDGIRNLKGMDAVSTDPPYGRSSTTNREPIDILYKRAFRAIADVLDQGKRMSVILPDERFVGMATDFRVLERYSVRVHRSLTRHFYLLERS